MRKSLANGYGFLGLVLPWPRLPGLPGPVPGPSLIGGLPGGCGSTPLPTPLFPFAFVGDTAPSGLMTIVAPAASNTRAVRRTVLMSASTFCRYAAVVGTTWPVDGANVNPAGIVTFTSPSLP